jgi:hypothetical protein
MQPAKIDRIMIARENHTSMKFLHCVVCFAVCIALVLASGCADTSFGTLKPTDFGKSAEEIKTLDYYKQKYGEPGQPGDPRFLEPTITTALDANNLPVDSITSLSTDAPKVYFWVFYDRFTKGDPMTITWTYLDNKKVVLTETRSAGGVYGRVFAEFVKPSGGWPVGKHQITITGKGTTASKTFEVAGGQTVTGAQPFTQGAATAGASGAQVAATTQKGDSAVPPPGACTCTQNRACGNWDGTWNHQFWGGWTGDAAMTLCQNGNTVTGTYIYDGVAGSLTGTVSGNDLRGTWMEYDSTGAPDSNGAFVLRMATGNNAFNGWFNYYPNQPVDTTVEPIWTGQKTGTCPDCGGGTRPTFQAVTTPALQAAATTPVHSFATAKTTTQLPWQTAATTTTTTTATTTPAGGTCGGHCNDPNRQCGFWDARWNHKNWGENLEGIMTLCQDGSTVTGTYNLGQTQGRISGTTSGTTGTQLSGTWQEFDPDGTVNGEGSFVFRLKSGNNAFDGWFNYYPGSSVDTSDSATWTGTKF